MLIHHSSTGLSFRSQFACLRGAAGSRTCLKSKRSRDIFLDWTFGSKEGSRTPKIRTIGGDHPHCNPEAARGVGGSDEYTPVENQDGSFDNWPGTCMHDLHHELRRFRSQHCFIDVGNGVASWVSEYKVLSPPKHVLRLISNTEN